jgi:hypothetical protein
LRLRAAERGIFRAVEIRRLLAEAGLEISVGKMSAPWSATVPLVSVRLQVLCEVLDCDTAGLLVLDTPAGWAPQAAGPTPTMDRARTRASGEPAAGPGEQAWGRGLAPLPVTAHETITEVSHLLGHDAKLFANHDADVQLIDHDREHGGCRIEPATPDGTLWNFRRLTGNGA